MKLFVTSSLPETMLSLIVLEPEQDRIVVATNRNSSEKLDKLGLAHDIVSISKNYSHFDRDKLGYELCNSINGGIDGYNLSHGLYPDRFRFWFIPQIADIATEIGGIIDFSEVYIESQLNEYLSWAIAWEMKSRYGSKVIVVKSSQEIYEKEFRYIDSLHIDEILVSHDRDVVWLNSITKNPVRKVPHVIWNDPVRPTTPKDEINNLREQVGISEKEHIVGIVYLPQDDWKLLALFRENQIKNYVLFYREADRKKFNKSVPASIRNNARFSYDSLSMSDICNTIYFPKYTPECDKLSKHISLVLYDFNNISGSEELIKEGII